ncbi:sigma-70 family RNA polymerase sigma factor [Actinomadura oligospora]|uniref:sigma-70 family RNA polymerase sigma factor n=1 Tax=Actinomadura oligospora TaxID=111804 RepID=UPI0004799A43|nr:sigma-70 family RNA polymerase sigma factor [Actinomadura oligospora]
MDFEERTAPHRQELLTHCYRMLGSAIDAEDLVQETMMRAWRSYDRFDERKASMRTWLYRIATNACLNALESRARRPLPSGIGAPGTDPEEPLVHGHEVPWLQPLPTDPAMAATERGTLRLAFVAALQLLPARQRAVLILRDVLDWSAAEVAASLETSPAAVNSALQRARARLAEENLDPDDLGEPSDPSARALVDRYVAAFERADLAALGALLTADVIMEMPPMVNWYTGRDLYLGFMKRVYTLNGTNWSHLRVEANGQPGFAAYLIPRTGGPAQFHTLQVLDVTPSGILRNTVTQDEEVFRLFNLPATLPVR